MDTGFNTIEFYAGDISGNFANAAAPHAVGGAQDNGPSSAMFPGTPTGPVQWQMGLGGDGFSGQIDPMGTGTSLRIWEGNNSGGLSRCTVNCTNAGAGWTSSRGSWSGDQQSFVLPINMFHGGIPGGDDCGPAGPTTGCGHLIAGTTRVWETISGTNASVPTSAWYNTNSTACTGGSNPCLTKGTLGGRSFINQVKYSPKYQSVAIVGTNDGNVQIGFNLGTGVANHGNWVNVTGSNAVLPNRPILSVSLDPSVPAADLPVGYAGVGGFNANTPTTPGHVFQVSCASTCASFSWLDKSGNLPDIPVDSIINNPNFPQQVFAGTDFGLYFTNDVTAASPVWYRFANGLPAVMIWDMQIDRGSTTLSLWTRGRGAFVWPLPLGPFGSPSPTATPSDTPSSTPTATPTNTPTASPTSTPPVTSRADFDGDSKTDLSVFRPSDGNWYYQGSTGGFTGVHFGDAADIPAPGDFDGDGKADISVFRPSNGVWYRINSSDGTVQFVEFGVNGDIPQAGDYDGDGKADQGVFRPSNGTWYWLRSIDNQQAGMQFGQNGDKPVTGDYDGDGKQDLSVFRGGIWYRTNSSDGSFYAESFGIDTDMPVPADYDGDNRDDIAVFRPADGDWYFHYSGGQYAGIHWGTNGDVPVPGDYDGDNRNDVAIYRDGVWYINGSAGDIPPYQFGLAADVPIPKTYIP